MRICHYAVQVTKKSSMEKFPSAAKYSDRSRAPDATHIVSPDTEYRAVSDPDQVVAPEERVKAYRVSQLHDLKAFGTAVLLTHMHWLTLR